MKLEKAIQILADYLRGDEPDNAPDLPDAIRLGNEALDRVRYWRAHKVIDSNYYLPGETEE